MLADLCIDVSETLFQGLGNYNYIEEYKSDLINVLIILNKITYELDNPNQIAGIARLNENDIREMVETRLNRILQS